jgi:antitoxin PrlF
MNAVFSKLTSKSQTVIPKEVRALLHLKPGDRLRFVMTENGILVDKASTAAEEDPFAVFTEWNSAADEKAYGNL